MSIYKTGMSREQYFFVNTCLNEIISKDSPARVIDAFVDSLDLSKFKYGKNIEGAKGNKPYNPKDLLKLFLLGYKQGIRSSRKLMYQAINNLEYIWLIGTLKPDFRTIADFRKDNVDLLKEIFFKFTLECQNLGFISANQSQDGVKLKAVNSKDNNFTFNKIDDRIKRIQDSINDFLDKYTIEDNLESIEEALKNTSKEDTDNLIEKINELNKLKELILKKNELLNLEKNMQDIHTTQVSLTDPESKLMRDNGKFTVAYNNQVMVDTESHLVTNFKITDDPADIGHITDISKEFKETYGIDVMTDVTDKGYASRPDMMNALNNGIIPEVTPLNENGNFVLETNYEENEITEEIKNSTKSEDIEKCLKSGIIPTIYENNIEKIEIIEQTKLVKIDENNVENCVENITDENTLRDIAMEEKCFARSLESDKVFCPLGEILRKKSTNNGKARYANKLACKNCKNPCCDCPYKTVDFSKGQQFSGRKNQQHSSKAKGKSKRVKIKKVLITTKPNFELLKKRMATSEHPHASMKFWDHSNYLLLKSKRKVTGEVALYYTAYNIRRMINIIGVDKLIEYFQSKSIKNSNNKAIFKEIKTNFWRFLQKLVFFSILSF